MTAPVLFEWDGESMVPVSRMAKMADREYVIGYKYYLEAITPEDQRSRKSHAHYFATVTEYWRTLPENLSNEPWANTPEFLRHYALVKTGWVSTATYTCGSRAEAVRWAGILPKPVNDKGEPVYHIRSVVGSILHQFTPRSQSFKGMNVKEFQESKDDVLGFLAETVGGEVRGL